MEKQLKLCLEKSKKSEKETLLNLEETVFGPLLDSPMLLGMPKLKDTILKIGF